RVNTPESLARHPVQEIIPRLSFSRSRAEVARIVGCAELIKPGVAFPGFNIVESSHRRGFFAWTESNLRNNYCSSVKLRNQAGWVMRERVAVLGDDHRFHIEVLKGDNADFRRRRRGRIKRFEVRKQITQRVSHRLENERHGVVLCPVKVLARELTDSHGEAFVERSLFNPPGIEPERVGLCHSAGTGQEPKIRPDFGSVLPERSRMKIPAGLAYQCF